MTEEETPTVLRRDDPVADASGIPRRSIRRGRARRIPPDPTPDRREHPTRVSIIDVETGDLRLVELGTSYTFRSLAMTEDGTAVVLGTDGKLHLIDPGTATEIRTIDVVDPWEEPDEWQEPRPALAVAGNRAYVTDPATGKLHAVALIGGTDPVSVDLPATPDEIVATKG